MSSTPVQGECSEDLVSAARTYRVSVVTEVVLCRAV